MNDSDALKYFISEKNHILVVNLIGTLSSSESHILESCIGEIGRKNFHFAVISFRDVTELSDRKVLPVLARLQKTVRAKPAQLRMSGLHPVIRKLLEDQGLLRLDELFNNLGDALKSIVSGKIAA